MERRSPGPQDNSRKARAHAAQLCQRARRAFEQGDTAAAVELAQRSYEMVKHYRGEPELSLADLLVDLETLYTELGQYEQAVALSDQALQVTQAVRGGAHPDVATRMNDLGMLRYSMGEYPSVEQFFTNALSIRRAVLEPNHADIAQSLNNLAALYYTIGEYSRARPLAEEGGGIVKSCGAPRGSV